MWIAYVVALYIIPGLITAWAIVSDHRGELLLEKRDALTEEWPFFLLPILNWVGPVCILAALVMCLRDWIRKRFRSKPPLI